MKKIIIGIVTVVSVPMVPPLSRAAGNPLIWDNANGDNIWDFAAMNWHTNGAANGTAAFSQGGSVVFALDATTTTELREDVEVDGMDVTVPAGRTWTLAGNHDLAVSGSLNVDAPGQAVIDAPRLTDPGTLTLVSGAGITDNNPNRAPPVDTRCKFAIEDDTLYVVFNNPTLFLLR